MEAHLVNRKEIYGRVKDAAIKGSSLGYTVNETAEAFGMSRRSIRSVADRLKIKLKPMRARKHSL
jgi:hypothetical protein